LKIVLFKVQMEESLSCMVMCKLASTKMCKWCGRFCEVRGRYPIVFPDNKTTPFGGCQPGPTISRIQPNGVSDSKEKQCSHLSVPEVTRSIYIVGTLLQWWWLVSERQKNCFLLLAAISNHWTFYLLWRNDIWLMQCYANPYVYIVDLHNLQDSSCIDHGCYLD
jgi:hypothetical protein